MTRFERLALDTLARPEYRCVHPMYVRSIIEERLQQAINYGNDELRNYMIGRTQTFGNIRRCRWAERYWRAVWEAFVVLYPEYAPWRNV